MLVVQLRDSGRENRWVTSAGSSLDARPILSDDFELGVCCVVCPRPMVAPTFAMATAFSSRGLVGAPTFAAAPTARSGRLMETPTFA